MTVLLDIEVKLSCCLLDSDDVKAAKMRAGRYSMRFAVNNVKATNMKFYNFIGCYFLAVQSCIIRGKFYL